WFDAPIGYIGFTRELFDDGEEWKEYWTDENTDVYYSIGKDNTIFHTIIWPSMLMGSSTQERRYNLPHYEFIHQFLLAEDTKFSKSRGKGLNTEDALDMYPTDYWRFYLATELPQQHDTTFSWESFENRINKVLNDTVGNFVNRPLSLAEQWFDSEVPDGNLNPRDEEILQEAQELVNGYEECFKNHDMKQALDKALALARLGDQYLSEEEPWNNEERREPVLLVALKMIRGLSVLLYPFTPDASRRIADMLNTDIHTEEGHDELRDALDGKIEPGHKLGERELLFEKIDVKEKREEMGMGVEETEEKEQDDIKQEEGSEIMEPISDETVSFDEFKRLDMRVAEVLKAEPIEDSDNLVRLVVDIGTEERQIIAGIKQLHDIEGLPGEKIIVVANLEPAEIFGYESNGMLLAAGDQADLLTTMGDAEPGEKVE
ncbi:MAG: class I tRNA ligase family protein, partial [Halobacteria archaeon]|nr:class I tRNA ligase family protein [Halobacteria archaeon]